MRVCVLGAAGGVGSATAAALLGAGVPDELFLVDVDPDLLAVQCMDLRLLAGALGGCRVLPATAEQAPEADVVVLAAAVPHRDGAGRMEFAAANRAILGRLLDGFPDGWRGILVVASNPVDVLATVACRRLGDATVVGYVRNDSLRLAQAIARWRRCPPDRVEAWVIGEHGPAMIPLFDRVRLDGEPLALGAEEQAAVLREAVGWYDEWQRRRTGRTSVWTTGYGVSAMTAALVARVTTCMPASLPLRGRYGIPGEVCLAVPARLGNGTAQVVEWPLAPRQHAALAASARTVLAASR